MQTEKVSKSPFTGGEISSEESIEIFTYRGETFNVNFKWYLCKDTNERFTTSETDEENLQQVYDLYRKKHSLFTKEEIKDIREQLGASIEEISMLTGVDAVTLQDYENGGVPKEEHHHIFRKYSE